MAYAVAAVAGSVLWGPGWTRTGEGYAALSGGLAAARRPGPDATTSPGRFAPSTAGILGLVAVWLGGLAFGLFSGTRAWVGMAGASVGWARAGRATAGLAAGVVLAGLAVVATVAVARPRRGAGRAASALVVALLTMDLE